VFAEVLKRKWKRKERLRSRRAGFSNIVRELPSSEIQVDVDGKNAAFHSERTEFLQNPWPAGRRISATAEIRRRQGGHDRQKDLRDGLRRTSYAISTDETRYVLNGLLFSLKRDKLTLVATDGRRLAMVDIELEIPRSQEADIIVPTKAVTELQRLLTD